MQDPVALAVALAIALASACRPASVERPPELGIERRASVLAEAVRAEGFAIDLARVRIEQVEGDAWLDLVGAELDRAHRAGYWDAMATLRRALALDPGRAGGDDVRDELVRARARARRAVYDASSATIFVAADAVDDPWLDRDLVRALARAFQDRHVARRGDTTTDAAVARTCLLEGHADVLALAIVVGRPLSAVDDAWFGPIGTPLAGEVEVTCAAGGRVLASVARDGGWPAALRVVETPLVSTEQLLHPEKRGSDEPRVVELPPWPSDAGKAALAFDDTLGELAIARLLRERGLRSNAAWRAAIGWDGDRLRVYRLSSGAAALVWRSVWDREKDARQFAQALAGARMQVVLAGRVVDAVACADPAVSAALVRTLAHARAQPPEDPRDQRSAGAAEGAGVPVD